MNNKFELLKDDTISYDGKTLYRIRALRSFGGVQKGDIGGYLEKEENLSDKGDSWIYEDAKVFGNARIHNNVSVRDSAQIYGDANIYNNTTVSGNARIYDNANVSGNTKVEGSARVYSDANISDDSKISGNAQIYGNARIYGDAIVCDNAIVSGNTKVEGSARVYGSANIHDNVLISGTSQVTGEWDVSPLYIRGTKYDVYAVTKKDLAIGNITLTVSEWMESNFANLRSLYNLTEEEFSEYKLYIELASKLYPTEAS